jgi:hypothetical protein
MKTIRIPLPLVILGFLAAATAAVVAQLPEIRRYLKMESM